MLQDFIEREGYAVIPKQQVKKFSFEELILDRITSMSDIPNPIPIVKINNKMFAQKGDISFVCGLPKAGKSAICTFIIAGAFIEEKLGVDLLGIETEFSKQAVIYIDTEQPKSNTKKIVGSICKILKTDKEPENLFVFNLRDYSREEKLQRVLSLFEYFPKAHLWIIDGIADLITDVNQAEESFKIIEDFMVKSSNLNTTIILLLHENPTGQKMRGHAGSEAERKGGGIIRVKKDKEQQVHCIDCHVLRNDDDFEPIYFRWSKERGRFISCNGEESREIKKKLDKNGKQVEKLKHIANCTFITGSEKISYSELIDKIMGYGKVKETQAYKFYKSMFDMGLIQQDVDGLYRIGLVERPKNIPLNF